LRVIADVTTILRHTFSSLVYCRLRPAMATASNDPSAGAKSAFGVFGGLRTGPISWLAQAEVTDDKSIANGQGRELATLLETDWPARQEPNEE
jgi:hypothetical protein